MGSIRSLSTKACRVSGSGLRASGLGSYEPQNSKMSLITAVKV